MYTKRHVNVCLCMRAAIVILLSIFLRNILCLQIGVAPYAALNFATYDLTKKLFYHGERWGLVELYCVCCTYVCVLLYLCVCVVLLYLWVFFA